MRLIYMANGLGKKKGLSQEDLVNLRSRLGEIEVEPNNPFVQSQGQGIGNRPVGQELEPPVETTDIATVESTKGLGSPIIPRVAGKALIKRLPLVALGVRGVTEAEKQFPETFRLIGEELYKPITDIIPGTGRENYEPGLEGGLAWAENLLGQVIKSGKDLLGIEDDPDVPDILVSAISPDVPVSEDVSIGQPTKLSSARLKHDTFTGLAKKVRYADSPDLLREVVQPNMNDVRESTWDLISGDRGATDAQIRNMQKQIYTVTQQALSEFPDTMTVYRIGDTRSGEVVSFTVDPNFTATNTLPWVTSGRVTDRLIAYTVAKEDILAAPNANLSAGKGTDYEQEVLINSDDVTAKDVDIGQNVPVQEETTYQGKTLADIFRSDIPEESWLAKKVDYVKSKGKDPYGNNHIGVVTGSFSSDVPITMPVSELIKLKGGMGEQENIRQKDLDWLIDHMGRTGKLPTYGEGKEHIPFITVDYEGIPIINEGNHRIMAADALGMKELPVEIRYFDGGERNAKGLFKPENIFNKLIKDNPVEQKNFQSGGLNMARTEEEVYDDTEDQMDMMGFEPQEESIDPVSGNEVPLGGTSEGVRDNVEVMMSEGEMVIPEYAVNYHGVETYINSIQKAQQGYEQMQDMGLMGNPDEATMDQNEPLPKMQSEDIPEYQFGGLASTPVPQLPPVSTPLPTTPLTEPLRPTTTQTTPVMSPYPNGYFIQIGADQYKFVSPPGQKQYTGIYTRAQVGNSIIAPVGTTPESVYGPSFQTYSPSYTSQPSLTTGEYKIIPYTNSTGDTIYMSSINGQIQGSIPSGYFPTIEQTKTEQVSPISTAPSVTPTVGGPPSSVTGTGVGAAPSTGTTSAVAPSPQAVATAKAISEIPGPQSVPSQSERISAAQAQHTTTVSDFAADLFGLDPKGTVADLGPLGTVSTGDVVGTVATFGLNALSSLAFGPNPFTGPFGMFFSPVSLAIAAINNVVNHQAQPQIAIDQAISGVEGTGIDPTGNYSFQKSMMFGIPMLSVYNINDPTAPPESPMATLRGPIALAINADLTGMTDPEVTEAFKAYPRTGRMNYSGPLGLPTSEGSYLSDGSFMSKYGISAMGTAKSFAQLSDTEQAVVAIRRSQNDILGLNAIDSSFMTDNAKSFRATLEAHMNDTNESDSDKAIKSLSEITPLTEKDRVNRNKAFRYITDQQMKKYHVIRGVTSSSQSQGYKSGVDVSLPPSVLAAIGHPAYRGLKDAAEDAPAPEAAPEAEISDSQLGKVTPVSEAAPEITVTSLTKPSVPPSILSAKARAKDAAKAQARAKAKAADKKAKALDKAVVDILGREESYRTRPRKVTDESKKTMLYSKVPPQISEINEAALAAKIRAQTKTHKDIEAAFRGTPTVTAPSFSKSGFAEGVDPSPYGGKVGLGPGLDPGTKGPGAPSVPSQSAAAAAAAAEGNTAAATGIQGIQGIQGGVGAPGGPKIICLESHRQGLLDTKIFEADEAWGDVIPKIVLDGYHLWAKPVVRKMRKSRSFSKKIAWLAKPVAKEAAKQMGVGEGSKIGLAMLCAGMPICAILGAAILPFKQKNTNLVLGDT